MTWLRLRGPEPGASPAGRAATAALLAFVLLASGCANLARGPGAGAAPLEAAAPNAVAGAAMAASATSAASAAGSDTQAAGASSAASEVSGASDASAGEAAAPRPLAGRLDPEQDTERTDLWQRVREGFAMPDIDDPLVHKWEQWYASQPDYVQRMTERGSRYLFYVLDEVKRRHMPTELALLPFVESAFNPRAVSRTRASGMWQFMPGTGKDFDLRQNLFRDDRRDVLVSTRAALDYLQQLHDQFNDWQLALAAYNWGPGNVQRAIERNRRAGLPTDFESLQRLPQETREYLPKLQAVKNIIRDPQAFALTLPPLENHPYFIGVKIERDIDVALAARLAGLAPEEFQQLNPQLNKPVILAAGGARLLLPYDNANRFLHALAEHVGPLSTWTAWVAPRTVTPAQAAHLTGMNEAWLREVNKIPPRMLVKAGSTLVVPRGAQQQHDVAAPLAENATIALAPEGRPLRRVLHRAGRHGETLASVALRYRVSRDALAQWNGVSTGARFRAGQTVVVMVAPSRAAARSSVRSSTHSSNHSPGHAPVRHRAPVRVAKAAARPPAHRSGPVPKHPAKHAARGRRVASHHGRSAEVTRVAQAQR